MHQSGNKSIANTEHPCCKAANHNCNHQTSKTGCECVCQDNYIPLFNIYIPDLLQTQQERQPFTLKIIMPYCNNYTFNFHYSLDQPPQVI